MPGSTWKPALAPLSVTVPAAVTFAAFAAIVLPERWHGGGPIFDVVTGAVGMAALFVLCKAFARLQQNGEDAGEAPALPAPAAPEAAGERRLAALLASASDVVFVLDEKLRITYSSGSSQKMLARAPVSLRNLPLTALLDPDSSERCQAALGAMPEGSQVQLELGVFQADGTRIPVEATVTCHLQEQVISGFVVNLRDLSDVSQFTAEIAHQSLHDPLTDLPNRRMFAGLVAQSARDDSGVFQVIVVDIDGFSQVNSSFGHSAGDQVLKGTAARLQAAIGSNGAVARLGGDDFGVLLRSRSRIQAADLMAAIALPVRAGNIEIPVTLRMGVADSQSSPDDMLRHAEIALRWAKETDRSRIEHYQPGLQERAIEEFTLKQDLRTAIENRELTLAYQPIVDLKDGRTHGVKALVRWRHPERGDIAPDEFVPLAEQSGMIVDLSRWVLSEATAAGVRLQQIAPDLRMSVNLSALHLSQPSFVRELLTTLDESGIDPDNLLLEITETAVVVGMDRVVPRLDALRCLGIHVSVDDFGTGYSSLNYLSRLPLDELKVDKSFVDRLPWDRQMQSVVNGMLEMSHGLGLVTVAEGIESPDQAEWLRKAGCTLGQGFLFGRPQTEQDMTRRLVAESATPRPSNVIQLPRTGS